MKIKKVSADAVKLHELTPVKLKTAGNTSVVQFTAGVNKNCPVKNLSKDTYLDKATGEIKVKKKTKNRHQSPKSVRKSINKLMDLIRCNVTSMTDAGGNATTYTYDAIGRMISFTDELGTVSYTYDNKGNVLTVTDHRGEVTRYEYDKLGNLTHT